MRSQNEWEARNSPRREGSVCRVCTDLPSDRASKYPWFTKFDDLNNEERECHQCHRIMRASFLDHAVLAFLDDGRPSKYGLVCKFPQSRLCEKIAKRLPPSLASPSPEEPDER
jgi:hypothetical protein